MAIVSVEDIQTFLDKPDPLAPEELDRINLIHPLVERRVKRFVRGGVEQATYTHFLPAASPRAAGSLVERISGRLPFSPAPERQVLPLPELPVRSIVEVREDPAARAGQGADDFGDATLLAAGTDYYLDVGVPGLSRSGHLVRVGGTWPARPRTVKVTYVAGWSSDELEGTSVDPALDASDIRLAVLHAIRQNFAASGDRGGAIQSERLGDYRVAYAPGTLAVALPRETLQLLRPFVRKACL